MPLDLKMGSVLTDPATRVVICCGAGGVGKTTTAAAMALYAAEQGRTVAVLTIDPARRLAQSLGMSELTNDPQPVDLGAGSGASGPADLGAGSGASGPDKRGSLDAMMLDMRRTFDEMVLEYSSPDRAAAIMENSFYQTMASSFSGTQEYMAMEKLGKLLERDHWDLIIVDTPPSRNALDFLDAPQRLGSFLSGRLMKVLVGGGRGVGRMVTGAMSLAMRGVSTIIGGDMLRDVAMFVQSLDSMFGGFQDRALRTYELLKQPGTQFAVVAAAEPDALREAAFFVDRLSEESMPLAGLILNRTHPNLTSISESSARAALESVDDELTRGILEIHSERAARGKRELHLLQRFTASHPAVPIVGVPSLPFEVADAVALRAVAEQIVSRG
ncbi:ArsA family ATPase [Gordonia sp. DT218]|uniref:ArsA family ATPase n=1 Tax=Gordonia sp. DT218 TaxID=3416659 RepID=UPI003CEB77BA